MCYGYGCRYERYPSGECRGVVDWNKPDAPCREVEEEDESLDVREQLIGLLNDYWWDQWHSRKEESCGAPTEVESTLADKIIKLVNGGGE